MVIPAKDRLLPAPFAEALRREIDHAEQCDGTVTGISGLALRIGIHDRRVRAFLDSQPTSKSETGLPRVEMVDRWLTALGLSIAGLYGSMYEIARMPERDGHPTGDERKPPTCLCPGCGEKMREVAPLCGFCVEEAAL